MDEIEVVALITEGGIYIIEENRWLKATAFRRGNVVAGVGGWETISRLVRAPVGAKEWAPTTPEGIEPGDIVGITSRSYTATTSEVAITIHGHDLRVTEAAQIPKDSSVLVMTRTQGFLLGGEQSIELLERGFTAEIDTLPLEPSEQVGILDLQSSSTLNRG